MSLCKQCRSRRGWKQSPPLFICQRKVFQSRRLDGNQRLILVEALFKNGRPRISTLRQGQENKILLCNKPRLLAHSIQLLHLLLPQRQRQQVVAVVAPPRAVAEKLRPLALPPKNLSGNDMNKKQGALLSLATLTTLVN